MEIIIERRNSGKDDEKLGRVMGEWEDSDEPVGNIASRTGFKEAKDGRFGGSGDVN